MMLSALGLRVRLQEGVCLHGLLMDEQRSDWVCGGVGFEALETECSSVIVV